MPAAGLGAMGGRARLLRAPQAGRAGLLALLLITAAGCKGGGSDEMTSALRCERDLELLAEAHACGRDEDCPCGAYCDLGLCASDCLSDDECEGGELCDAFGRCTDPEALDGAAQVDGASRGALLVDRTLVELLEDDSVQFFRVGARIRDLDRARIAAGERVEVACGREGDFGAECALGPLVAGAPTTTIRVRRAPDAPAPAEDAHAQVDVHARGQHVAVGVRVRGEPPAEGTARRGVYTGTAQLVGAGLRARTASDALPEELRRLELPIEAHVFPESGGEFPVRLFDEREAVFAPGSVGRLALDSARNWNLEVVRRAYLTAEEDTDPLGLDVLVSGSMQEATFREGLLNGHYVAAFEGMTPASQAPFVRWRLTLVRTGDLPDGAEPPELDPDPVPDVESRATDPFPEEMATVPFDASGETEAAARAIAALCTDGTEGAALVTSFGSRTYGFGDLECGSEAEPQRQRAFGVQEGQLVERGPYLTRCAEALEGDDAPALGDASAPGECLDRVRTFMALGHALDVDRGRAFGEGLEPERFASRIALRTLQQWMSTQELVAMEPRRLYRVGPLLPEGPDAEPVRAYADRALVAGSLQSSVDAWSLVLHPRVASALVAMSPQALHDPDYRSELGTYSGGEQTLGLPVGILYTLTGQLEGMRGLVDDLLFLRVESSEAGALADQLARFLPRGVVVFALAQGLYDAARSVGEPDWENAWRAARVDYGSALTEMRRGLEFLETDANPLGIEDVDLPLYRLGDEEGVIERFTALSDSLLGREDALEPAIAPTLIEQAAEAAGLARDSIRDLLDRDLTDTLQEAATERRLEQIRRRFGEEVASLCGDPSFDSFEVLDMAGEIDPDRCFLAPECDFSPEDFQDRLSTADVGYRVCIAAKLRERYGDAVSTGQEEVDAQLDMVYGGFGPDTPFFSSTNVLAAIDGFQAAYEGISTGSRIDLPDGVDAEAVAEIQSLCESARQATLEERPTETPDSCEDSDECPAGSFCRSETKVCEPDTEAPDPSCFWGSMGEVALAIQGAATDVDIARSELEEFTERYDNAMRGCLLLQQGNRATESAISSHNATMDQLGSAKLTADIAANVASAAKDAFSLSDPYSAVGAVVAGGAEAAAQSTSDTLAFRMEQAERAHELTLEQVENEAEERICFNEAEAELVGTRSAALRIRRQSEELARLLVELDNMKIAVGALLAEGEAALANEETRRVSPAHVDYWLDGNLDLFELRMRRARRALYLAVLGVEYEFQLSSPERANVLAAQTPGELEAVLGRLRERTRRGAPERGGNPTELLTVLSVRQNLMQLADRSSFEPTWHNLPEQERFGRILASPRYAVYDEEGRYVGQEIPFTIQPFGTLKLGDTGAIPLLSGLNCAERLWHVNATVLGEDLMARTDSSIATVQLRKRNTFASQWCDSRRTDPPTQVATTRPSRNLFIDPFSALSWQRDTTLSELTDTQEVSAFAGATIQARTNVDRRGFESADYEDGRSQALAGRGVFGDYTLFIPATTQSLEGSAGLRLGHVSDILIRLDYVAAEDR